MNLADTHLLKFNTILLKLFNNYESSKNIEAGKVFRGGTCLHASTDRLNTVYTRGLA